jgi:lysozyme family protein
VERAIGFGLSNILASATAQGRSAAFVKALAFVLEHEGVVFETVAGDAGGATCCGITQEDYNRYRHETLNPGRSVEQITALEVANCYYAHYWAPVHADFLPSGLALALFDAAVNCGVGKAVGWLQAVLGITADGTWGTATSDALHAYVDAHGPLTLTTGVMARRRLFYRTLGAPGNTDARFLAGWLNRCDDLEKVIAS